MKRSAQPGRRELVHRVVREIRERGPVDFSRFMEIALHHPRHGYYATGPDRIGTGGDYFTASDVGSVFGEAVARQIAEMDVALGRPKEFGLIEFGAGRGLLARDVQNALAGIDAGLSSRLRTVLLDRSPGMREAAARACPESRVADTPDAPSDREGCVVAVELFDALPVRRIRRRAGELRELFVDVDGEGRLVERELPVRDETLAVARRYRAAPGEGDEAEVCLLAAPLLDAMAATLARGFLLIVDYGHPAPELYDAAHARGTLLAYRSHATNQRYLEHVGEQDLTAHVNFTLLMDHARERGLDVLGLTTQDRFLIANGILEEFRSDDPASWSSPARVRRRLQAMQLIHPESMGRRFRVLLLSKGIAPPPRIRGTHDPFRRDAEA